MSKAPSTSSKTVDELFQEANDRGLRRLVKLAEEYRIRELNEKRLRYGRYLEKLIQKRERELGNMEQSETGYTSEESEHANAERRRRNNTRQGRNAEMWERIRARNRQVREERLRKKKLEEKKELDALFHAMLNDGEAESSLFDSNDFELRYPEFLEFDKIRKEINAGMNREVKKEKEENETAEKLEEEKSKPEKFFNAEKIEPEICLELERNEGAEFLDIKEINSENTFKAKNIDSEICLKLEPYEGVKEPLDNIKEASLKTAIKAEKIEPEISLKLERYEAGAEFLDGIDEINPEMAVPFQDSELPSFIFLNLEQMEIWLGEPTELEDIDISNYTSDIEEEYYFYRRADSNENEAKVPNKGTCAASTSAIALNSAENQEGAGSESPVYVVHGSDSE